MMDFKVLVCEDDELAREFLVKKLSRILNNVYEAENGEIGLELYKKHNPDLIITDINMPIIDGIEMIKTIRKRDKETSIVVVSAFSDNENLLECIENGVNRYLVKPIDRDKLLDTINEIRKLKRLKVSNRISAKLLEDYKKAFDIGSILTITDGNGIITYANDAFCQVSGFTKDELIGKTHRPLRHPKMPASFYAKLWSTVLDGKIFNGVIENRTKDGGSFITDTTIIPIKDEHDSINEFIAIRHNLTKVSNSYEKDLRGIIENNDTLSVVLNDYYVPIIINQNFKDFFGDILSSNIPFLSRLIFEDDNPLKSFQPEHCEEFIYNYNLINKKHQKVKVCLENSDKYKVFVLNINTVKNNILNQRKYHIISFTDITELEQMKDEQISSSKLAYIGQLSASITHEINTPLTYIKGNLELMKMDVEDYLQDEKLKTDILDTVKTIEGGIKRISSIIDTMREATGVSDNVAVPTNIYKTIIYSLRMIYAKSKHISPIYVNGVEFSLLMDTDTIDFKAFIAPQRVEQVWIIILNNALDELEKKSELNFDKRFVKIEIKKEADKIIILFKDNAGGVDKEILGKIFESFVSTKKGSTSAGMGLGLNIAKTIIDHNSGTIDVYNEDDGAVFKIEFELIRE